MHKEILSPAQIELLPLVKQFKREFYLVGGTAIETALKSDLGQPSSTQKALESLLEQGIIDKLKNKYVFTDPLYQRFIKQNL